MADHLRIYRGPESKSSPKAANASSNAASSTGSLGNLNSLLDELDERQNDAILQLDQLNKAVEQLIAQAAPQIASQEAG